MSALALLAAALVHQVSPAPALPDAARLPLYRYGACLFQPFDASTYVPEGRAQREAMASRNLERCQATRRETVTELDRILTADPAYANPDVRRSALDALFSRADQQMRVMIVEHERFDRPIPTPLPPPAPNSNHAQN